MRRTLAAAGALAFAVALAGGACAQSADPTLPPPGLDTLAAGADAPPPVPAGPELQSILVSNEPGGRRIAVISGEMVWQGSRFQGAVVEKVGNDRVVLRRGKVRETLRLNEQPAQAAGTPAPSARQE
ncbi:MSHA biogenesis protein MshK [Pseudoduganella umbonata]|uniref:MSHA biogenesis protein MshK n=1 Tax=Pseudoduganella umbonata TaxID=864828 RepID=A0A4P8HN57_9BURK|nr:MSHA biogenesis protein MshK [Pseudoduganella umbonata]MBB3219667.1 MSHA biogenesis protein MshK [Pseudoduganella umbonata]QCP09725.1 MSHA biogenesis protein MshK [Pseudoduganella umbonata]